MWLQSCSLVSAILKMMMVWNSVGETRPEARGGDSGLRPHVLVQANMCVLVNLILTQRYGRAKTAKNGANHFQKRPSFTVAASRTA